MNPESNSIDFQSISLKKLPFGVLTFNMDGFITNFNALAASHLNIEPQGKKLIGLKFLKLITNKKLIREINNCLTKGKKKFILRPILYNNKYLHIRGIGTLNGILLIILDETDIVTAQHNATQNLILGQEAERGRLAKEIHDGLGPLMSTIRLEMDALSKTTKNIKILEKLESLKRMVADTALEMRQISHDLMPSSLADFGLITSIINLSNRINNSKKVKVYFDYNIQNQRLNANLELNIFRIVQELVNNALKHAFATEIQLQIRVSEVNLYLTYEDDGKGVDITKVHGGIGLANIRTRVKSLNGFFEIDSSEGNGFLANAVIPLN